MEEWHLFRTIVALSLVFVFGAASSAQNSDQMPRLLLSWQRLRRLKRDRQRQTVRWTNFENRVQSVPDSPQRGFELALFYAITGDDARGKEAWRWALAHPCERRQVALVLDWAGGLGSAEEKQRLGTGSCPSDQGQPERQLRDTLFMDIATGRVNELGEPVKEKILQPIEKSEVDSAELYALCELLIAVRANFHEDVRGGAPDAFRQLPAELLLRLKPPQVDNPDWITHIAALALVAVDPDLQSAQFLQGWAMEDRQTVSDGPGVAYEFLWADPYLPGIGYQNLDPWVYQPAGRLFARTDWTNDACWISISAAGLHQEHCPPGLDHRTSQFGHLTLIPATGPCTDIPRPKNNESVIIWELPARQKVLVTQGKTKHTAETDAAGMWLIGSELAGKACVERTGQR